LPRSFYDSLNTQTRIRERSEKNGKHCFDGARGGVDVVVCVVVVLFFDENDDGRKKQHTQHRE
jgi:hypothetical protein